MHTGPTWDPMKCSFRFIRSGQGDVFNSAFLIRSQVTLTLPAHGPHLQCQDWRRRNLVHRCTKEDADHKVTCIFIRPRDDSLCANCECSSCCFLQVLFGAWAPPVLWGSLLTQEPPKKVFVLTDWLLVFPPWKVHFDIFGLEETKGVTWLGAPGGVLKMAVLFSQARRRRLTYGYTARLPVPSLLNCQTTL